ncbi:carbohydrate-binding domain-containing protein [Sporosarcina gallistercoris]|uniref:Carbohydrate-binding domain-containing protein n=1 Tax=Sporosarcina gallistercoris TaxID=2762245 RepID=A0ABR8PMB6_9BACL|nr:carbohydrate-binding domain-containing protein [Sporosarcina gallistercoris]MBD7909321.1 carbohydrate-binding domain-containing protein [Sporosarcina gallistercoris]
MTKRKWKTGIAACMVSTAILTACSQSTDPQTDAASSAKTDSAIVVNYTKDELNTEWDAANATSIELTDSGATFNETDWVSFEGKVLTIKAGGTYVLSGNSANGQIVVDAEDEVAVHLIFNGVSVTNEDGAAVNIIQAEQTILTLAKGTENSVKDGAKYEKTGEDDPNAVIFSKDDLSINGSGSLTVEGLYNNGILSKDELKIAGAQLKVQAKDDGIIGKDLAAIKDGNVTISSGGDGIKATNSKEDDKGNVALETSTIAITAGAEGIQAKNTLSVNGGTYTIAAGGGSPETVSKKAEAPPGSTSTSPEKVSKEQTGKGLKASQSITITDGSIQVDASDDAIHSNGDVTISGGTLTLETGDDGIHGDGQVTLSGGKIDILKSYEGIEGNAITISDGTISVNSTDDGVNISSTSETDDPNNDSSKRLLTISGGHLSVNANGDGLDANGSIAMTGGTVLVEGPMSDGDGALDYDETFQMDGGILIASGSAGMAMASSDSSKQPSILMTYSEVQKAGTLIHLEDSTGEAIATVAPSKDYQAVFISSPDLKKNETYSLFSGGKSTGTPVNGLYQDGTYSGGKETVSVTLTDTVTWMNESGVTEAKNNMHGAPNGGMPGGSDGNNFEKGQKPDGQPPSGEKGELFDGLDENVKKEAMTILEKERSGELTREEAQQQLAELGVEMPQRPTDKK